MKVSLSKKEKFWFILIGLLILSLTIIFSQFSWLLSFADTGEIGDTIGGITAPFMSFFGSVLVYLALKSQIDANKIIQDQFDEQKTDNSNNFEYLKFKERIHLVIKEIDNFSVAFHEGKLIAKLNETPISGKKHNFNGVQGLNLFLIEFFRDEKEKEKNKSKEFNFDDSYHSVAIGITNLVVLFYNTHISIEDSFLSDKYKEDLTELLTYVYQSKVGFLVHHFLENNPSDKLLAMMEVLIRAYNKQPKIN
jgi:hypothetical protein